MKKIILLTVLFLTGSLFAVDIETKKSGEFVVVCIFKNAEAKRGFLFIGMDGTQMDTFTQVKSFGDTGFADCSRSKK
tara:strand:- start:644 stop:874 length:231 start_codon:yes stop_codon:yes gene_type:complete